ncbi:MAG: tripartite tricarboxylate transporter TctB family protein [Comamonadaceae bacterium]|nr:MAG: tripartite tricarboxylate transporter TctB family protein [Comamonadaceae bacterium]
MTPTPEPVQPDPVREGGQTARSDMLGGAGWMAFGAAILFEALRMDRFEQMGATLYTMPGFVPGMIGGVLMLLGAVLALRGWSRRPATAERAAPLLNGRMLWTLALTLVYAAGLIGRVNFIAATALFVGAFVWLFTPEDASRRRRWIFAVATGVLSALVVGFVFEDIFLVRLP